MKVSNHSDSAPLRVHSLGEPRKHFLKKVFFFSCNSTAVTLPLHRSGPEINRWCHGVRKLKLIFFKKIFFFLWSSLPFREQPRFVSALHKCFQLGGSR